jgi:hypothetical protein
MDNASGYQRGADDVAAVLDGADRSESRTDLR